jgi:3-(3-hydroxy-phenyl)propionate hydroxylase
VTLTKPIDVIIVGYGPVGAMLGLLLREQGVRSLIIERDTELSPFPRAAHFDDEVIRIYQAVGLGNLADAMSNPPRYTFFDTDWTPFLSRVFPVGLSDQGHKHDYMFFQPDVERAMRTRLATGPGSPDIRLGHTVTNVAQDADGVTVGTVDRDGVTHVFRAGWLVGCDGAASSVRKSMGSRFEPIAESHQWYVVDIEVLGSAPTDPGADQWEYCDPDRIVTYVPLSGPYRRFEFDVKPGESEADLGTPERTWELISPWFKPHEARVLRNDIYRFHSLLADSWREGRMLIAGDAAHVMCPKLGQGLCCGMRDVANLSWKIARVVHGAADASLLDSYQDECKPVARQYIEISAYLVGQIITKARDVSAGKGAVRAEPVVEQIVAPTHVIGSSAMRAEDDLRGTLSAQPILADGRHMDEAVGLRFALVARPSVADSLTPADRAALVDLGAVVVRAEDPTLAAWLDKVDRVAVLIRPDRYVAGSTTRSEDLSATLADGANRYGAARACTVNA